MKRLILMTLLTLAAATATYAQQVLEDVVYLHDSSVIRGIIVEQIPNDRLKIETLGGSVFVLTYDEIQKITREPMRDDVYAQLVQQKRPVHLKEKGYKLIVDIGALVADNNSENDPGANASLSVNVINGYQFWPQLWVGAGIGLDRYRYYSETYLPAYFAVGGAVLKKRVTPIYYGQIGYSHWLSFTDNEFESGHRGSLMWAAGAGIQVNTRSKISWQLTMGYKYHKSESVTTYPWNEDFSTRNEQVFKRVSISTGITF